MRDNTVFGNITNHTSERYTSGELSSYDNHPADIGTEVYMQDMQNSLTNMKKAFTTLLCLLFCITISAQDKAADLSKFVGDWSFSAPDAPYGYQDGSFQIKQENGKLTAKVNIQGSTLEINDIKAKGDTYTSSFYVDGTPVDLTMTQKGNELEGMADAGGMQIPVKFKKTKK